MVQVYWALPDKDSTYNQTLIYRATSPYGTYSLIATLTDITIIEYTDTAGTSASWYKIRFYDSVNTVYSSYSNPAPGSATVASTNYTTPKLVAEFLGSYRSVISEATGTGDGATTTFQLLDPKIIEATEYIYNAGVLQKRNLDYTVNYETGLVTFGTAPTSGHAITSTYWASSGPLNSQFIKAIRRAEDTIDRTVGRGFYQPQQLIESVDSYDPVDTSPFAFMPTDYMSDTQSYQNQTSAYLYSRVLQMSKHPIVSVLQVLTNAQQFNVTSEAVGTGNAVATVFSLLNSPVVYGSEVVYLSGVQTTAYSINYTTGIITFNSAPGSSVPITCDYQHCSGATVLAVSDYRVNMEAGLIYLNTSTSPINEQMSICTVVYTYGYVAVPPIVEDIATKLGGLSIMASQIMGSPTSQSVNAGNIGFIKQEIEDGYRALGKKISLTRI